MNQLNCGCGKDANEACRRVVVRTFSELTDRGLQKAQALRAAWTVLRLRHPEMTRQNRGLMFIDWMDEMLGERAVQG